MCGRAEISCANSKDRSNCPGNGLKASASAPYTFYYLEQITSGTGQPVKFPNGDDIAFSKLIEHPVQFWTIAVGAGDLLAKDSPAPGFLQRFELKSQPLILGIGEQWSRKTRLRNQETSSMAPSP
jgi:hypothetical protein